MYHTMLAYISLNKDHTEFFKMKEQDYTESCRRVVISFTLLGGSPGFKSRPAVILTQVSRGCPQSLQGYIRIVL
jgi:hypothetical protein